MRVEKYIEDGKEYSIYSYDDEDAVELLVSPAKKDDLEDTKEFFPEELKKQLLEDTIVISKDELNGQI